MSFRTFFVRATPVFELTSTLTIIFAEWGGVDTVIIAAGVSALQPLMAVAGLEGQGGTLVPCEASRDGIQRAVDVTAAATRGNYVGPLISAIALVR